MDFSKLSMKKIRELIMFTALLAAALWKFDVVIDVLKTIWGILFPFALGGAIAFVINVPMSFLEKMLFGKSKAGKKKSKKLARPVSLLLTMILAVGVMVLVMFGVIPQLTRTMGTLMMSIADFIPQMQSWIRDFSHNNQSIMNYVNQIQFQPDQAIRTCHLFHCIFLCLLYSFSERTITHTDKKGMFCVSFKTESKCTP